MNFLKPIRLICVLLMGCFFSSCASQYGKVSFKEAPTIINVSHFDPKEIQRGGASYSPLNQYNLRRNGALGQIARCSKGYAYDSKCGDFLVGAERQGFLLGAYHYVTANSDARTQARRFVARLKSIKRSRGLRTRSILLVADMDTKATVPQMVAFVTEVKNLTGKYPMVYLENGELIRSRLRAASSRQKNILQKCPYWLALYSSNNPGLETPLKLTRATGVWKTWALWQYGGVEWENRRSVSKHYVNGKWKTPRYFGNLSKPLERNGFNGSKAELYKFWAKHSWYW